MAFITLEIVDDEYVATEGVELYTEDIGVGYKLLTAVGERLAVIRFLEHNASAGEDISFLVTQILKDAQMDEHNSAASARPA